MILGNDHIATPTVYMGADGIQSPLFYDTKFGAPLCVESAHANAYGLALVILLQALSWVDLMPIDWTVPLSTTFVDNLFDRKT
ncbi:hypothetical protein SAMN04490208_4637 [Pseudomonas poae]|uniref:Uncharacterized protein n=1 Tax=Pseudomonas poae TaxID=200451 RepID=A0ABY0S1C5_9PSED|nr:hypothetical protein SAMN04490208_4637 [Pseudomonas poae]